MEIPRYTIIEDEVGPLISESRATVYDVMEAYDAGDNISQIGMTYNLSPLQVETAIEYIEKHRERLEPKLREILRKAKEREQYYRALAAEIEKNSPPLEMTSRRKKLHALLARSRQIREEMMNASYP